MILWEGASQLDGKPIVVIATDGSRNEKTGDMVQVWILRSDIAPHKAVKSGDDASICGDCPQRHFLGGACYVVTFQGPLSVYRKFKSGGYADPKHVASTTRALQTKAIRMGAYGDPGAVPFHVWESLIAQGTGKWTGYTHQWRRKDVQPYRALLMASCDSEADAIEARKRGWRYFLVVPGKATAVAGAVECLSDARGLSCEACGICDGTRADSRSDAAASVAIQVHGFKVKRFALNVVR